MRRRRRMASLVTGVALLVPGLVLLAPVSQAVPAAQREVTASGTGEFAGLTVAVSQTTNLIDQVVEVSWTGGAPTQPLVGSFDRNYLQIMQCWGDDPAGPTREQCQFGGLVGDGRGGNYVASRQANYGTTLVDPAETYRPAPGSLDNVNVPFQSVTGKTVTTTLNEYYDSSSTNELPFARTRPDGTGREFFEVETAREAPGLGCGNPVTDPATGERRGRSCWLAVVPRGSTEVDGSTVSGGDKVVSSPLSASNWDHRIVIPLTFQPNGIACPIGSAERRTVGQESVAEAINHWQPTLCEQSGTVYGFSSVGDALARNQLRGPTPGLVFVSQPLPADDPPAAGPPVYAPVAVSGLAIAFNIDSRAASNTSPDLKLHDGERIGELNLSARLVAKLLTQSYRLEVNGLARSVTANPLDLLRDPEFLALNPAFKDQFSAGLDAPLEPLGLADVFAQLWAWVDADPDAHAFLQGTPDPWGASVNPNYKDLELPRSDLPKSDPYCLDQGPLPPLCTLDAHPYAADLHQAARSASRGDVLTRTFDPVATPPSFKKGPVQLSGSHLVMAITDTASAERFRLPMAKLLNAAGNLVAPTTASLLAGAAAMTETATPGVLQSDPRSAAPDAYPLTSLSYAATVPAALDAPARKDYAALLTYIAGAGQQPGLDPGQLPPGYAPLPQALRDQTLRAAALVAAPPTATPTAEPSAGASAPDPPAAPVPTAVAAPVAQSPAVGAPALSSPPPTFVSPPVDPLPVADAPSGEVLPAVIATQPAATGQRPATVAAAAAPAVSAALRGITPNVLVGTSRVLVGVALLIGALAALGAGVLHRVAPNGRGGARA